MTTRQNAEDDPAASAWHLDKRIPIALLIGLLCNAAAGVWWASQLTSRVDSVERAVVSLSQDHDRIIRMEETLNGTEDRSNRNNDRNSDRNARNP